MKKIIVLKPSPFRWVIPFAILLFLLTGCCYIVSLPIPR